MFHPLEDSSASADIVAPILFERHKPKSVLDLGCNTGAWARAFERKGVRAVGVDGPGMNADVEYDLQRPLFVRSLDDHLVFDSSRIRNRTFDIVLCLEVAEHIPEDKADVLVDSAIRHATKAVIWSAATPGQGGYRHVNEQPHDYWVKKFADRGWTGKSLANELPPLPHDYYRKNMWEFTK